MNSLCGCPSHCMLNLSLAQLELLNYKLHLMVGSPTLRWSKWHQSPDTFPFFCCPPPHAHTHTPSFSFCVCYFGFGFLMKIYLPKTKKSPDTLLGRIWWASNDKRSGVSTFLLTLIIVFWAHTNKNGNNSFAGKSSTLEMFKIHSSPLLLWHWSTSVSGPYVINCLWGMLSLRQKSEMLNVSAERGVVSHPWHEWGWSIEVTKQHEPVSLTQRSYSVMLILLL